MGSNRRNAIWLKAQCLIGPHEGSPLTARVRGVAGVVLTGLLIIGACSDDSADEAAPTTSLRASSTDSTASPAPTTSSAPSRESQSAGRCAQAVVAVDLDVPVDRIHSEPECVDGFALVVVCEEDGACPEGYTVLATVDGRWERIGHTLQTCTEELSAQGVTPEAARRFEGYFDCFSAQ